MALIVGRYPNKNPTFYRKKVHIFRRVGVYFYSKSSDIISVAAPDESVHVALQLIISVLSNLNFPNKSLPIVTILALS